MNPQVISQTGVGASPLQALARDIDPFTVSFSCVVNGAATYTIQYTYDDPNTGPSGVIGGWPPQSKTPLWDDFAVASNKTANLDFSVGPPSFGPCFGWRVNVTAGTGTVTVTATQAGIKSGGG